MIGIEELRKPQLPFAAGSRSASASQRCRIAPDKEMQLLIALAASAAALKPNNRLDAAAVTLDRPVAPLPTFAPLPVVADAPEKALAPDLPLRRAALREWAAENNRVEGLGEKIEVDSEGIVAAAPAKKGDILFAMSTESVVTAHAAYNDPDLLSLRPIAQKAGPGFGVVAVAALLAVRCGVPTARWR